MDSQRNFFLISFLFISFMVWQTWQKEDFFNLKKIELQKNYFSKKKDADINNKVTVDTDVLSLVINDQGNIEQARLLNYPEKLNSKTPFSLLTTQPDFLYQVQSGFIKNDNEKNIKTLFSFNFENKKYKINDLQKEILVPMTFIDDQGIIYKKTFSFKQGEYVVGVHYNIVNPTNKDLTVKIFGQLQQSATLKNNEENFFAFNSFRGAAYSTDTIKYKKHTFENILEDKNLNVNTQKGWIAMLQQYFVTAWIPNETNNYFYTTRAEDNTVIIGYESSLFKIDAGKEKKISSNLWIGPEIQSKMAKVADNLDLTVDYGWLWFISQPLFKLLKFIYSFINNWGFSIIIITLFMRLIMYPLTKTQYVSAAKMRLLQPKIKEINDKFNHNKSRISQEIFSLYKKEKVNPLGGCLPLLIQMPIFLALYYMLISSVELRHAPFIFWIHDLSSQDPYYVLPIIMCITMLLIQKSSPNNINDPMQKKIMNYMPILFTLFFLWCPSGLVLYYIVSNLVTIIQQKIILYNFNKKSL